MGGSTSGSDTRVARELDAPVIAFDLDREVDGLRSEPGWAAYGRSSKTLAKADAFRIVLASVRSGTEVGEQGAHAPLAVHVLRGRVTARRGASVVQLGEGGLAWFGEGPGWSLTAAEDSAVLLSLSWPEERATEASRG